MTTVRDDWGFPLWLSGVSTDHTPTAVHTLPFQAAVMPCSGCREPLNLSDMVWLSGGRVGCAQCARTGR